MGHNAVFTAVSRGSFVLELNRESERWSALEVRVCRRRTQTCARRQCRRLGGEGREAHRCRPQQGGEGVPMALGHLGIQRTLRSIRLERRPLRRRPGAQIHRATVFTVPAATRGQLRFGILSEQWRNRWPEAQQQKQVGDPAAHREEHITKCTRAGRRNFFPTPVDGSLGQDRLHALPLQSAIQRCWPYSPSPPSKPPPSQNLCQKDWRATIPVSVALARSSRPSP